MHNHEFFFFFGQKLKSKQQRSTSSLSAHRPPMGKKPGMNDGRSLTAVGPDSSSVSATLLPILAAKLSVLFGYKTMKYLIQVSYNSITVLGLM